ncbi:hypothetical protein CR513_11727, partial [Mucuna pruriens]
MFPGKGQVHSKVHLSADCHMQPHIQTPSEEPENGVELGVSRSLRNGQTISRDTSRLVLTIPGKPLILYLTMLEESMGCVLGQQDASRKKEQATYYLNKKFTNCEQRYPRLERTYSALVWTAKRLRQYMLAQTTWLIAKMDPLKYIFAKPTLTRRIARWQMSLSDASPNYMAHSQDEHIINRVWIQVGRMDTLVRWSVELIGKQNRSSIGIPRRSMLSFLNQTRLLLHQ